MLLSQAFKDFQVFSEPYSDIQSHNSGLPRSRITLICFLFVFVCLRFFPFSQSQRQANFKPSSTPSHLRASPLVSGFDMDLRVIGLLKTVTFAGAVTKSRAELRTQHSGQIQWAPAPDFVRGSLTIAYNQIHGFKSVSLLFQCSIETAMKLM